MTRIIALPGDGIGPEIMDSARSVLDKLGGFETTDHLIGGASIDQHGTALTSDTLVGNLIESLPEPLTLEYVRLNISARKPE